MDGRRMAANMCGLGPETSHLVDMAFHRTKQARAEVVRAKDPKCPLRQV